MKPILFQYRHAVYLTLLSILLVAVPAVFAEGGREFSGAYQLADVTDLGDAVSLTLELEISNHRDRDAYDVEIVLRLSDAPDSDHYSLTSPLIGARGASRFSIELILNQEDYEAWSRGVMPTQTIQFQNDEGALVKGLLQLTLSRLGEED